MFNVFDNGGKSVGKDSAKEGTISSKILKLLEDNNFLIDTVITMYSVAGAKAIRDLELKVSKMLYDSLNESETHGEAFMIAVITLLHSASHLDDMEEDFKKLKG